MYPMQEIVMRKCNLEGLISILDILTAPGAKSLRTKVQAMLEKALDRLQSRLQSPRETAKARSEPPSLNVEKCKRLNQPYS